MKQSNFISFNSLQGRHLFATIALSLIVVVGVFSVFFKMQEARQDAANNLESRGQLLADSRHIHDAIWQGYLNLDWFLLDPSRDEYAEKSIESFKKARVHANYLLEHSWLAGKAESTNLLKLPYIFDDLLTAIEHLVVSRKDPAKQYPALEIGNIKIGPTLRDFINAINVFIDESSSIEQQAYYAEVYPELIQTRYLWTQMISNFRIYLANQFSSYDESLITIQEEGIQVLYSGVFEQLEKLSNFESQNKIGFQGSDSLETLYTNLKIWHEGFVEIKESYHSGNWRTDVKLMSTTVEPRLSEIWNLLLSFELMLEESVSRDIDVLNASADQQENLLWSISLIILALAMLSFISMRRLIFQPIAHVTRALHDEASGSTGIVIPPALTLETRNLIDAFTEMRSQIHNRQMALEHKSLYDELTGLPNRTLFFDRVKQSLSQALTTNNNVALISIDVRHLKEINDTLGHSVGDRVVMEIGKRLQEIVGQYSTVSRTSNDEFAVLLYNSDEQSALEVAQNIDEVISENIQIENQTVHISLVIGISIFPDHADNHTQLYQRADIAKHLANKNMHKVMVYSSEEDEFSKDRLNLMSDLKYAIENNMLELHYQPKLDLKSNRAIGVEALLRWNHSRYGWVNAEEIVLIAEQCGLIDRLTHWTVTSGIKQCADWRKMGIDLTMAINLSVHALQKENFAEFVQFELSVFKLPAHYLVFEITESAMMTNPLKTSKVVYQLDKIGVVFSADDFGTGFSSYTYLKHIPIDEIKIDKSFIVNMLGDGTDTVIVKSVIDLAHSLGLSVVAEGVESDETRKALQELNCEFGQGYQFSKALTAKGLTKWLNNQSVLEEH